jgi:hypothetical protein
VSQRIRTVSGIARNATKDAPGVPTLSAVTTALRAPMRGAAPQSFERFLPVEGDDDIEAVRAQETRQRSVCIGVVLNEKDDVTHRSFSLRVAPPVGNAG